MRNSIATEHGFGRGWIERCYEECEFLARRLPIGWFGPRVEDDPSRTHFENVRLLDSSSIRRNGPDMNAPTRYITGLKSERDLAGHDAIFSVPPASALRARLFSWNASGSPASIEELRAYLQPGARMRGGRSYVDLAHMRVIGSHPSACRTSYLHVELGLILTDAPSPESRLAPALSTKFKWCELVMYDQLRVGSKAWQYLQIAPPDRALMRFFPAQSICRPPLPTFQTAMQSEVWHVESNNVVPFEEQRLRPSRSGISWKWFYRISALAEGQHFCPLFDPAGFSIRRL